MTISPSDSGGSEQSGDPYHLDGDVSPGTWLNRVYQEIHQREMVPPDPLQFLYGYPDPRDREIVGLVASCLAYGRVGQILKSVSQVLVIMGDSPREFIADVGENGLDRAFSGFRHRFARGRNLAGLLGAVARINRNYGGLYECFMDGYDKTEPGLVTAQARFYEKICGVASRDPGHLLPNPLGGSACKRLNLFLRWMVREDDVDPGGWPDIPASRLIIPLDTHMYRIGIRMEWTKRRQAGLKTAMEITEAFRKFSPDDPVKYDFSLTRIGIRPDVGRRFPVSGKGRHS